MRKRGLNRIVFLNEMPTLYSKDYFLLSSHLTYIFSSLHFNILYASKLEKKQTLFCKFLKNYTAFI